VSLREATTNRRQLVNWFLGTSVGALFAAVVYPVARYVSPPRITEAATNQVEAGFSNDPELMEKGFKIVRFGTEPVILLRVADGDYRAFSATCTHLDCIVDYRKDKRLIWCWCHNGIYDLSGKNIGGPPPRPLTPFEVRMVPERGGQAQRLVVLKA